MSHKKAVIAVTSTLLVAFAFIHPASAATTAAEFDETVLKPEGPPSAPHSECETTPKIKVCFEAGGDKIWLKDLNGGDIYPAKTNWSIRGGRYGQCAGTHTAGKWGVCNKNFPENKTIDFVMHHSSNDYTFTATT
ncbi:hypothetical protein QF035_005359 [Streptomyces umbrinus]|uniref:Secreted protein n=1 Tax=Streptomyces umbrinus TaxID=67370 RepID=A0ABU0SW91_9ACTN|nr:hypothetical protein [Streptomyces umbrinus]